MVWIVLACMTAATVLCVVWPLSRARGGRAEGGDNDLLFYRAQMDSIERDIAHGLVASGDAAGSRAEIGRRLLAAADRSIVDAPSPNRRRRVFAASIAVVALVPAVSLLLYLRIGAPEVRDIPLASRAPAEGGMDLQMAIARVESHLASHADDGRGFDLIAPLYVRLGRYADAGHAYERAIELLGDTAKRRSGLGEALTMAGDGVVTTDARAAFNQALADDPHDPQAQFYLGLAAQQDGDLGQARAIWTKFADASPTDAPWLPTLRTRIAALDKPTAQPPLAQPSGTPTGPAAAAIAAMPPQQQMATIEGMVNGLAARLESDGQDTSGWLRLVRAYTVLGQKDKALAALATARKNLSASAESLSQLDGLARELGLES